MTEAPLTRAPTDAGALNVAFGLGLCARAHLRPELSMLSPFSRLRPSAESVLLVQAAPGLAWPEAGAAAVAAHPTRDEVRAAAEPTRPRAGVESASAPPAAGREQPNAERASRAAVLGPNVGLGLRIAADRAGTHAARDATRSALPWTRLASASAPVPPLVATAPSSPREHAATRTESPRQGAPAPIAPPDAGLRPTAAAPPFEAARPDAAPFLERLPFASERRATGETTPPQQRGGLAISASAPALEFRAPPRERADLSIPTPGSATLPERGVAANTRLPRSELPEAPLVFRTPRPHELRRLDEVVRREVELALNAPADGGDSRPRVAARRPGEPEAGDRARGARWATPGRPLPAVTRELGRQVLRELKQLAREERFRSGIVKR